MARRKSWTADSTKARADRTDYTADGWYLTTWSEIEDPESIWTEIENPTGVWTEIVDPVVIS